jgi:GNAT superfamily N-acetyltransferase
MEASACGDLDPARRHLGRCSTRPFTLCDVRGDGVEVGDRGSVWLAETREWFTTQLATSDVAAFVAQTPDGELVAGALGQVTRHAPSPANPSGVSGQLSSVVTDPEYRRLGLSRACVEQLLTWFRDFTDANDVGLFATDCGASLYESLGFAGRSNPAMSLNIRHD